MSQPNWKLIAQLGDNHPLEYGGYFIYEDETGVYAPEGELLICPEDPYTEGAQWTVYRFSLEKCICDVMWPYTLSDNKYHPDKSAWFAPNEEEQKARPQDGRGLHDVASFIGVTVEQIRGMLCSWSIVIRAEAWRAIGEYYGMENLDPDPLKFTHVEIQSRYAEELRGMA